MGAFILNCEFTNSLITKISVFSDLEH